MRVEGLIAIRFKASRERSRKAPARNATLQIPKTGLRIRSSTPHRFHPSRTLYGFAFSSDGMWSSTLRTAIFSSAFCASSSTFRFIKYYGESDRRPRHRPLQGSNNTTSSAQKHLECLAGYAHYPIILHCMPSAIVRRDEPRRGLQNP